MPQKWLHCVAPDGADAPPFGQALVVQVHKSSHTESLENYHGVPEGWSKKEILGEYANLDGQFSIDGPDATEPGAPAFLPDRFSWLQYRETLRRIGDGVRENDHGCIELAIRYIELNYFGSYSGYICARLARTLKNKEISTSQKNRLRESHRRRIDSKECFEEFSEIKKLIENINEKDN